MSEYDVVGIGNAIVDVLAKVEDTFLATHNLKKSNMILIDEEQALAIYKDMPSTVKISGGSAANTLAGLASFGAKTAFIGKVRNDELGKAFSNELKSIGVHYTTEAAMEGPRTAKCLVCVTPDAERTMATFLGATKEISPYDIDEDLIKNCQITYIEGYLWDEPHAKEAIRQAIEYTKKHDKKIAFTLSDTFCVERHRHEFIELINNSIDILFANESEIKSLFEENDINKAVKRIAGRCETVIITRGEKGSIVIRDETHMIKPKADVTVVDLTGAGDLYASGFLYGYINNASMEKCGQLGTIAASEIIQHMGARPQENLATLIKNAA